MSSGSWVELLLDSDDAKELEKVWEQLAHPKLVTPPSPIPTKVVVDETFHSEVYETTITGSNLAVQTNDFGATYSLSGNITSLSFKIDGNAFGTLTFSTPVDAATFQAAAQQFANSGETDNSGFAAIFDSYTFTATGSAGGDFVRGYAMADTFTGGAGDDTYDGAGGNDTLAGNAGNDTLTGGAGNDLFIYDARGADVITDFTQGQDKIKITSGYTHFSDLTGHVSVTGGNTEIDFGGGNKLTLQGFTGTLASTDFEFVDNVPPTVISVAPSGSVPPVNAGSNIQLHLTASEAVTVVGFPTLKLSDGGTATYVSGSGTTDLIFSYTVLTGQNSLDLKVASLTIPSGASIKDGAGNNIVVTGAANQDLGFVVDTVAPAATKVTTTSSNGSYSEGQVVTFALAMSEAVVVDTTSGTPKLILDDGGFAIYNAGLSTGTSLVFEYTVGSGQSTNALKVTGLSLSGGTIEDPAGNVATFVKATGTFSGIHVDTLAPTVTSVSSTPASGNFGVGTPVKIMLTMSEVVNVSGSPLLQLNVGNATYTSGSGSNTLTFTYTPPAGPNTPALQVVGVDLTGSAITDLAGNPASLGGATATFPNIHIDTAAPTVESTSVVAANTHIGLGGTATIKLDLGEAVTVKGKPTLTLSDGETATYLAASSDLAHGIVAFAYKATANHTASDLQITSINLPSGAAVNDLAGNPTNFAAAAGVHLGLAVDTQAPTITSGTTPATGTILLGQAIVIDIATNEDVVVAGAPTLVLSDGGVATYNAANSTATNMEFDYVAASGQNTLDLKVTSLSVPSGSSIKDVAGNAIVLTGAANQDLHLAVNTVQPTVTKVATAPASGAVANGNNVTITLTMSDIVTVTSNPLLTLNNGATAHYVSGSGTNTLVFDYSVGSEGTTDLQITGINQSGGSIKNTAGNAVSSTLTSDLKLSTNVFTFVHAGGGDWNTNANWSPASMPGAGNTALLNAAGTVTSGQTNTVGVLNSAKTAVLNITSSELVVTEGTGSGAILGAVNISNGAAFGIAGSVNATGMISLNATNLTTDLAILGDTTLSAAGKITASDSFANRVFTSLSDATVTNASTTISGAGVVGNTHVTLTNGTKGIFNATGVNNALTLAATGGTMINSGILESTVATASATAGGLVLSDMIIQNTSSKVLIQATKAGAHVDLDDTTIIGGTLKTAAGASINVITPGSELDGSSSAGAVVNSANLVVNDAATLTLKGPITNSSTIALTSTGHNTHLLISGDTTVSGAGKITILDNTDIHSNGSAATLHLASTISGAGEIGDLFLSLDVQAKGIINAISNTNTLTISTGALDVANAGKIEASGTGGLSIQSLTTINNDAKGLVGAIASGAVIDMHHSEINGGTVSTVKGSTLEGVEGLSTITGSTIKNAGTLSAHDGDLTITSAFGNSGILDANNGHLTLQGAITGSGTATIENDGILEFGAASSAKVTFGAGDGTLMLDQATSTAFKFTGTITGLNAGDHIDFGAINFTTGHAQLLYVENSGHTGGALTVGDGTHTETITLVGHYALADFQQQQDANHHFDLFL